ncbi:MAG: flagellar hook-associated protein FlgL [Burkholderiaceae bacterium]|nr:flagellar hook-associated protein FlgL [Burkholderiaceae bacterium]
MRIATANTFEQTILNLQNRQNALQTSQEQLTSGKRVEVASDDPTSAAIAERSQASANRVDADTRALNASQSNMTAAESALGSADDLMQQIREALMQAGDGTYGDAQRAQQANAIQGLRNQLLAIANTQNGSGTYLFGGQGSGGAPFLDGPNGVTYNGTAGQTQAGQINTYNMTVDGLHTWMGARNGNGSFVTAAGTNANTGGPVAGWIDSGTVTNPATLTGDNYTISITGTAPNATYTVTNTTTGAQPASGNFTPGQTLQFDGISTTISGTPADGDTFTVSPPVNNSSVFDVLDKAIAALKPQATAMTSDQRNAQVQQTVSSAVRDLDASMSNIESVRSLVGTQLSNLQNDTNDNASLKLLNQTAQSNAEDLDMTQGISNFQNQQTGYQAALQAYASVQKMSMLQYINTSQ